MPVFTETTSSMMRLWSLMRCKGETQMVQQQQQHDIDHPAARGRAKGERPYGRARSQRGEDVQRGRSTELVAEVVK